MASEISDTAVPGVAEGVLLRGPFPRMGGKNRPAGCVWRGVDGAVALAPATSLRSRQPGRVALELAPSRAFLTRPTWMLAPLTFLFPAGCRRLAQFEIVGALSPEELSQLQRGVVDSYGADWRAEFARRGRRLARPSRAEPRRRSVGA